jgi:outer membrane receptor protein involved in Fe transport
LGEESGIARNRVAQEKQMAQFVARCLLAFAVSATLCPAQVPTRSVHGTVHDQTGAVIPHAQVTVRGASSQQSTTTAANGDFSFEGVPVEAVTLTVEAHGFARFERRLAAADSLLNVVLAPASVYQEVSIAANRSEMRLSDTAESVSILSYPVLESAAALPLDGVLREVPGFTLFRRSDSRTANPTSQGVSLRGIGASGAGRALVLYNGIPLNDPFGGWIYWGQIPRQSVDSVEILEGGASSLYGSGALGGVVNIIPLQREQNLFVLEAAGGGEETGDFFAADSWKAGAWTFDNSAAVYRTSGYVLVPADRRGTVDTPADSSHQAIQTTLRRMMGKTGSASVFTSASFYNEARDNGTPVQVNDTQLWQIRAGSDFPTRAGNFQLRGYGGGQSFNQTFSSIAVTRASETLVDSQHVPAQQLGGSLVWSRQLDRVDTLVGGADGSYKRGFSNETTFAASRPSANLSAGGNQWSSGIFLQDMLRLGPRALVTAGGRYDNWNNYDAHSQTVPLIATVRPNFTAFADKSEHAFSPRAAALLVAGHHITLTASAYKSFRGPTLNELYRGFRVGNTMTLANSQLRAERLSGAESGANLSFGRARFHAAFFWMAVSDPIANVTLSTTPTLITNQRQNLGRTRSRGVEAQAEWHYHNLDVTAGYQFVDAEVTSFSANPLLVGLQLPQVAPHQFTFQSSYRTAGGWSLALQGRASGSQFEDDLNLLPLDSFFQLDTYVAKRLHSRMTIFAAVENILNSRVVIGRTPVPTLGPPLLLRAGFKMRFP